MWNRKEAKAFGKERFKMNYWKCVLAALLLAICSMSLSVPTTSSDDGSQMATVWGSDISPSVVCFLSAFLFAVHVFVLNPLSVGCYAFFKDNVKKEGDLSVLTYALNDYVHSFSTLLLRDVFIILWTLLFIIPGLVKGYSYRMVPFILRDNPKMTANEVITQSRKMMDGHKWDMFVFDLSYIGWFLLGCLTLGIVNVFWTEPYRQSANAYIYTILSAEENKR